MKTSRLVSTILAASLAAAAIAAGTAPAEGEVELYEPCTPFTGATIVTPEAGFNGTVPTPVGTFGSTREDAGLYQVDLAGLEVGTLANVRLTLSFDTPLGLGDYDLVINGTNELSTESPEVHTLTMLHCSAVDLETEVFLGTPLDTLTLDVTVN